MLRPRDTATRECSRQRKNDSRCVTNHLFILLTAEIGSLAESQEMCHAAACFCWDFTRWPVRQRDADCRTGFGPTSL